MAIRTTDQPALNVQRKSSVAVRLVRGLRSGLLHLSLITIAIIWLVPTLGLFVTSFRPQTDILSSGWWTTFLSFRFTLFNYQEILNTEGIGRFFMNSVLIAGPTTVFSVLIASLAAYGLAWLPIPGRDWIFLTIVALMMVPIQMTLIPVLQIFSALDLTKSRVGIWIAHTTFGLPFAIFLLRNFFITLPRDLIEAARIDGASHLGIFFRIILPLSVPALASLSIFQFLWVWNDLLMALIFIQDEAYRPLTAKINSLLSTYGTEWHLLSAGAFILMSVPLIVFFSLQRYFVTGLMAGSVK